MMFFMVQAVADLILLALAFGLADLLRHGRFAGTVDQASLIVILPLFAVGAFNIGLYSYDAATSLARSIGRMTVALGIAFAVDLLFWFASKSGDDFSRVVFFGGATLSFLFLAAARVPAVWLVRHTLRDRFMRRMLVIDRTPIDSPDGFETLDADQLGLVPDIDNPIMLHNFSNLVAGADRVVVSCPPERREQWAIYLKGVGCWGELLVPELHGVAPVQHEPDSTLVGVRVSVGPLSIRNRIMKRTLDLAICVPVIVLLTPVLLLTAIAIKLDSPGPILFRQRRMGRGNRLFDVYKFRSMRAERTDHDGARSASRNDDRITRVGRIIRATSIDELPQLFNVLEGDMSLVGPRPHALGSVAGTQLFWQVDQRYWLRHAVKPGITGLAQVRGHRGATDHENDLVDRLRSDLEYLSSWTIFRDVTILLRTGLVLVHKNAY
jgi:lipopolysaccharide/colanic/teichoic acid biosynthesis glycosyltransferase